MDAVQSSQKSQVGEEARLALPIYLRQTCATYAC